MGYHLEHVISTLVCVLYVTLRSAEAAPCTFPSVLYMDHDVDVDHRWRFLSPDATFNRTHKTGQWHVHQHSAYVSHGQSMTDYDSVDGYDLECMKSVGHDKVLVKRLDSSDVPRYTCIQFIKRSLVVVQLKIAPYSNTLDETLCNKERLKKSDTPLVYFDMEHWSTVLSRMPYMTCGVDGGYVIRQWQDEDGSDGCINDFTNALRVEDECDKGSGFRILGESKTCQSPLAVIDVHKEPLYCIARWRDKRYTYSVGTGEWGHFFICMRMPKDPGNEFQLDVFLDGVCDSTTEILHSKRFRTIQLHRHVASEVCADVTPFCTLLTPQKCVGRVAQNCRHTCNTCPMDRPWKDFEVPEKIRGEWLRETSDLEKGKVVITHRVLQSKELGTWRYFGMSPCNRTKYGFQKTATEHLFLSTSSNGCLPRAATLMVNQFSPSVLGMQLSKSEIAEFPLKNGTNKWNHDLTEWCKDTRYVEDENQLRDKYHTGTFGWYSLINMEPSAPVVDCDMTHRSRFTVELPSGQICDGNITQKHRTTSFEFELESCRGNNQSIPAGSDRPVRHDCLAVFQDEYGWKRYVITRTPSNMRNIVNETYVCWWLLTAERRGYMVSVADCLLQGKPLATLQFDATGSDPSSLADRPWLTYVTMLLTLMVVGVMSSFS